MITKSDAGERPAGATRDLFLIANNIDELGGVPRVGHVLAGLFSERGHRVRLIGVRPFEPRHPYRGAGYSTHVLGPRTVAKGPDRIEPADLAALDELFGAAERGIVICMQVHAMRWVAAAETAHLRIIGQSHESFAGSVGFVDRRNSRFHRIMRLYRDIDAAVFLSDADARHFRRCGLNNTAVIRNPVHVRAARAASLTEPTIISVGRLAPEKNHRALIEAFALLADDFPSWRLRIVGDGPLRDRLVEQCRDQGLSERVHFTGAIEHVEDELMAASVFALSSESEGLALSALEAMACGVPVVMFDCSPGLREVVTDGKDVVVVAQGLVTGLADGLRRLMADEELRRSMGAAARETARRYSAVVDEWEELFDVVER